jgi:BlaI family penicillinase repressor
MKKTLDEIILTPHELEIMKVVWDMGAASVKNVHAVLSKRKKIAYTTVLTIMGILESKGVLIHTKSGRAYIYRPVLSRGRAMHNQVADIVERFFDGNPQMLIESVQQDYTLRFRLREKSLGQNAEVLL